jgi:hypothetical protein
MTAPEQAFIGQPVGTERRTIHGNLLRRFPEGWCAWEGWSWDRLTVYSDDEAQAAFVAAAGRDVPRRTTMCGSLGDGTTGTPTAPSDPTRHNRDSPEVQS